MNLKSSISHRLTQTYTDKLRYKELVYYSVNLVLTGAIKTYEVFKTS